ncbi:hypothetical protein SUGI_0031560 [Cryptomeria japonica]|nr:hypothetical protein SUGI_0031560 [Cryptomeria japonica]
MSDLVLKPNVMPALVVVGSANADIYVEVDRIPREGETIAARTGQTLAGGKGANQAACAARLAYPTYFIGQVGKDAHGMLIRDCLASCGVRLDHLNTVSVPTGHAVVMLQPSGQNSIIIVGGANVSWPRLEDGMGRLSTNAQHQIRRAGAILLQREIPDSVNIEVAKIAKSANVPVILDAGGMDDPIPDDLLKSITILSPNETELLRLTGMPTDTVDQVVEAATKFHERGVNQVLVKRGEQGSILVSKDAPPIIQPAILAPVVLDTTGAGDTFTAAFSIGLLEKKSPSDSLKFAAAAASLCVQIKGAIPSMPHRSAVLQLLQDEGI